MKVEIIAWSQGPMMPDGYQMQPEEIAELCGRTCYKSAQKDEKRRTTFLKGIIQNGHESVIEHCTITMRFSGVSRALTHQLVRHRLFSFSQESQRYVRQDQADYIIPKVISDSPEARKKFESLMNNIWEVYRELLDMGIKKEDCRAVLPNATSTEIVVTGNFREWRHFINMRSDIHAQSEIRHLSHLVNEELTKLAPAIFSDLTEKYMYTDCEV